MKQEDYLARFKELAVLCGRFNTNFIEPLQGDPHKHSFRRLLETDMAAAYDDPQLFPLFEQAWMVNPSESRQFMLEMPQLTQGGNSTRNHPSMHDLIARISLIGQQVRLSEQELPHRRGGVAEARRYGLRGNVPVPEQTLDELNNATCLLELLNELEKRGALSPALMEYRRAPHPDGLDVTNGGDPGVNYASFKEQLAAIGKLAGTLGAALEAAPGLANKPPVLINKMDTHLL